MAKFSTEVELDYLNDEDTSIDEEICPAELGYLGESFVCKEIFDTKCGECWNQPLEVE